MYRIEKLSLISGGGLVLAALCAAVFGPAISMELDRQKNAEKGSQLIHTAFTKVQSNQGNAILLAPPYMGRGYQIYLDGKSEGDWNRSAVLTAPVPTSVKVGTRFSFAFRHYGYIYTVTGINTKGIEVEVGNNGWFSRSPQVLLPWK